MRNDLKLFNLQLADLYIMLPRISINDEQKRKTDIALFKALLPFIKAIEAPGVTLSTGLIHPEDDTEAFERSMSALKEMFVAAKTAHIPVSIEPHMDSMAQSSEQIQKYLDALPDLKLTLDWAHLVCQGMRHNEIVKLIPHARHIQLRQAARAQLQVPFKRGRIDVPKVVNALQEADYSGIVCVEYMQQVGWHGMIEVNSIVECTTMRDALRDARESA